MRLRRRVVAAVTAGLTIASAIAWCACSPQRDLELVFFPGYLDGRGLTCVDDGGPLTYRAKDAGSITVVADLIAVPSVTSSLLAEIQDACADGGCPLVGQRWCGQIEVPGLDMGGGHDAAAAHASYVAAVLQDAGYLVTPDAPHQQIVARVVFTTQPCPIDPAPPYGFDRCRLVGCVLSAPFDPDVASGPVTLDLDVPMGDTDCEPIVCGCAELGSSDGAVCAGADMCRE